MKKNNIYILLLFSLTIFIIIIGSIFLFFFNIYHTAAGIYIPIIDVIIMKGDQPIYYLHSVANHEIGHHIFYETLNESQRKYYSSIQNNSIEQFANDYSKIFVCTTRLEFLNDSKKEKFFDEIINDNYYRCVK